MAASTPKSDVLRGMGQALPFLLLAVPLALLYGVVATEAGLSLSQVMSFSVLLIAGAAQFAALQQMLDGAAVVTVIAAALAVNLRMAMYSASLVPHLGATPLWQRLLIAYYLTDQSYAFSMVEYDKHPEMTVQRKVRFFLGLALPVSVGWYSGTFAGAALGARLPEAIPLDFALPILFLAVVAPMLKTRAHFAAAGVSVIGGLLLADTLGGAGLLVAAALALLAGAFTEARK